MKCFGRNRAAQTEDRVAGGFRQNVYAAFCAGGLDGDDVVAHFDSSSLMFPQCVADRRNDAQLCTICQALLRTFFEIYRSRWLFKTENPPKRVWFVCFGGGLSAVYVAL